MPPLSWISFWENFKCDPLENFKSDSLKNMISFWKTNSNTQALTSLDHSVDFMVLLWKAITDITLKYKASLEMTLFNVSQMEA